MASSASAATFTFPQNQTFDADVAGWDSPMAGCISTVVPDLLAFCTGRNVHQPDLGAPQGSLETRFAAIVGALTDVEAHTASVWSSTFTYNQGTPTTVAFSYARRSELLQLIDLGQADASVKLVDTTAGTTADVVPEAVIAPVASDNPSFTQVDGAVDPSFLVPGHTYRLELHTGFEGFLTVLGGQRVNYDNVKLTVEAPPGSDRNARQVLPGAGGLGACTTDDTRVATPPGGPGDPAGVRLSAGQLLINQRISQAGVRRVNAVIDRITAGLTGEDIRDCALSEQDFNASFIAALKGTDPAGPSTGTSPVRNVPTRVRQPRDPAAVQLKRTQLIINQRIAQAMVRRVNAVRQRLNNLTAGDFLAGSLDATALATDMRRLLGGGAPVSTAGSMAFARITPAAPGPRNPGAVTLSRAQLLINQRISQAGVRRVNQIQAELAAGITGRMIADGSIVRASLTPPVQTGS